MIKFFKRLFCNHRNTVFIKNIYGDEINLYSTGKHVYRSIHQCKDCGTILLNEHLFSSSIKKVDY